MEYSLDIHFAFRMGFAIFLYLARVCFRYRVETVAMEFVKNMSMFIDANLFFVQIFKCVFVAAENWGENGF